MYLWKNNEVDNSDINKTVVDEVNSVTNTANVKSGAALSRDHVPTNSEDKSKQLLPGTAGTTTDQDELDLTALNRSTLLRQSCLIPLHMAFECREDDTLIELQHMLYNSMQQKEQTLATSMPGWKCKLLFCSSG